MDSIYILTILIGSKFNWDGAFYLVLVSGNVAVNSFKKCTFFPPQTLSSYGSMRILGSLKKYRNSLDLRHADKKKICLIRFDFFFHCGSQNNNYSWDLCRTILFFFH